MTFPGFLRTISGVAQHVDAERLAAAFRRRRAELRLPQDVIARKAGVSLSTVSLIENARRSGYQPLTKAAVEEVIGWEPGSIDALLAGGDATIAPQPDSHSADIIGIADGRQMVLQTKEPAELTELLDRMPEPTRALWERLAYRIADELAGQKSVEGVTISDGPVTIETDSGPAQIVSMGELAATKAQLDAAAARLTEVLQAMQSRRSTGTR